MKDGVAENDILRPSDRFRFSELGKSRSPKLRDKRGTVISVSRSGKVTVLLDGNKHPTTYHKSYLEPLTEGK
ncbi:MAG: hypothetical protein OJF48_001895 [Afipia sp.]|jgi:hypothetical protein|nr:MAG: hypothetical protein OJF48_001895 [Afipia sp.]